MVGLLDSKLLILKIFFIPMRFLAVAFLFLGGFVVAHGQSLASHDENLVFTIVNTDEGASSEDWTFHLDDSDKVLYIDFEKLGSNIYELHLNKPNGELAFTDNLLDLPVNTLYELDLKAYPKGLYIVELLTFKGTLRRELVVE